MPHLSKSPSTAVGGICPPPQRTIYDYMLRPSVAIDPETEQPLEYDMEIFSLSQPGMGVNRFPKCAGCTSPDGKQIVVFGGCTFEGGFFTLSDKVFSCPTQLTAEGGPAPVQSIPYCIVGLADGYGDESTVQLRVTNKGIRRLFPSVCAVDIPSPDVDAINNLEGCVHLCGGWVSDNDVNGNPLKLRDEIRPVQGTSLTGFNDIGIPNFNSQVLLQKGSRSDGYLFVPFKVINELFEKPNIGRKGQTKKGNEANPMRPYKVNVFTANEYMRRVKIITRIIHGKYESLAIRGDLAEHLDESIDSSDFVFCDKVFGLKGARELLFENNGFLSNRINTDDLTEEYPQFKIEDSNETDDSSSSVRPKSGQSRRGDVRSSEMKKRTTVNQMPEDSDHNQPDNTAENLETFFGELQKYLKQKGNSFEDEKTIWRFQIPGCFIQLRQFGKTPSSMSVTTTPPSKTDVSATNPCFPGGVTSDAALTSMSAANFAVNSSISSLRVSVRDIILRYFPETTPMSKVECSAVLSPSLKLATPISVGSQVVCVQNKVDIIAPGAVPTTGRSKSSPRKEGFYNSQDKEQMDGNSDDSSYSYDYSYSYSYDYSYSDDDGERHHTGGRHRGRAGDAQDSNRTPRTMALSRYGGRAFKRSLTKRFTDAEKYIHVTNTGLFEPASNIKARPLSSVSSPSDDDLNYVKASSVAEGSAIPIVTTSSPNNRSLFTFDLTTGIWKQIETPITEEKIMEILKEVGPLPELHNEPPGVGSAANNKANVLTLEDIIGTTTKAAAKTVFKTPLLLENTVIKTVRRYIEDKDKRTKKQTSSNTGRSKLFKNCSDGGYSGGHSFDCGGVDPEVSRQMMDDTRNGIDHTGGSEDDKWETDGGLRRKKQTTLYIGGFCNYYSHQDKIYNVTKELQSIVDDKGTGRGAKARSKTRLFILFKVSFDTGSVKSEVKSVMRLTPGSMRGSEGRHHQPHIDRIILSDNGIVFGINSSDLKVYKWRKVVNEYENSRFQGTKSCVTHEWQAVPGRFVSDETFRSLLLSGESQTEERPTQPKIYLDDCLSTSFGYDNFIICEAEPSFQKHENENDEETDKTGRTAFLLRVSRVPVMHLTNEEKLRLKSQWVAGKVKAAERLLQTSSEAFVGLSINQRLRECDANSSNLIEQTTPLTLKVTEGTEKNRKQRQKDQFFERMMAGSNPRKTQQTKDMGVEPLNPTERPTTAGNRADDSFGCFQSKGTRASIFNNVFDAILETPGKPTAPTTQVSRPPTRNTPQQPPSSCNLSGCTPGRSTPQVGARQTPSRQTQRNSANINKSKYTTQGTPQYTGGSHIVHTNTVTLAKITNTVNDQKMSKLGSKSPTLNINDPATFLPRITIKEINSYHQSVFFINPAVKNLHSTRSRRNIIRSGSSRNNSRPRLAAAGQTERMQGNQNQTVLGKTNYNKLAEEREGELLKMAKQRAGCVGVSGDDGAGKVTGNTSLNSSAASRNSQASLNQPHKVIKSNFNVANGRCVMAETLDSCPPNKNCVEVRQQSSQISRDCSNACKMSSSNLVIDGTESFSDADFLNIEGKSVIRQDTVSSEGTKKTPGTKESTDEFSSSYISDAKVVRTPKQIKTKPEAIKTVGTTDVDKSGVTAATVTVSPSEEQLRREQIERDIESYIAKSKMVSQGLVGKDASLKKVEMEIDNLIVETQNKGKSMQHSDHYDDVVSNSSEEEEGQSESSSSVSNKKKEQVVIEGPVKREVEIRFGMQRPKTPYVADEISVPSSYSSSLPSSVTPSQSDSSLDETQESVSGNMNEMKRDELAPVDTKHILTGSKQPAAIEPTKEGGSKGEATTKPVYKHDSSNRGDSVVKTSVSTDYSEMSESESSSLDLDKFEELVKSKIQMREAKKL